MEDKLLSIEEYCNNYDDSWSEEDIANYYREVEEFERFMSLF